MQRLILAALDARPGGDEVVDMGGYTRFTLAPGVHDLREVSKQLAREHGGFSHADFISPTWEASFSRAVRHLRRRGAIAKVGYQAQCRWVRRT
jgi:hypothetical protein